MTFGEQNCCLKVMNYGSEVIGSEVAIVDDDDDQTKSEQMIAEGHLGQPVDFNPLSYVYLLPTFSSHLFHLSSTSLAQLPSPLSSALPSIHIKFKESLRRQTRNLAKFIELKVTLFLCAISCSSKSPFLLFFFFPYMQQVEVINIPKHNLLKRTKIKTTRFIKLNKSKESDGYESK